MHFTHRDKGGRGNNMAARWCQWCTVWLFDCTGHVLYTPLTTYRTVQATLQFDSDYRAWQALYFLYFICWRWNCDCILAILELFSKFVILVRKIGEALSRGIKINLYPGDLTGNTLHILKIYFTFQIISRWNFLFHFEIR